MKSTTIARDKTKMKTVKKLNRSKAKTAESLFHIELEDAGNYPPLDPVTIRRASMAQHAEMGLRQGLNQLEAAVARNISKVSVRVNDVDISTCGGFDNICRAIARAMFNKCRYFEHHLRRLTGIPEHFKAQMQRAYYDYQMFAGDDIDEVFDI